MLGTVGLRKMEGVAIVRQPVGLPWGEACGWALKDKLLSYQEMPGTMEHHPRAEDRGGEATLAFKKKVCPPLVTSGHGSPSAQGIYSLLTSCPEVYSNLVESTSD